uniref:HTH_38 domain-containing protein n=1 Tax=Heterorhabditis bacteriophora TaxID=37862 RepID=A0A1I7WL90_HETBA
MSKGKNITSNQRVMIRILLDQNLSQVQIAKKLELSRCSVQNATKHITKSGILENAPRTRRNRNTTKRIDGTIRRQCEDNRQLIARDIHDEVKAYRECSLSVTPIRQPQNKIFVSFEELEGPSCTCTRTLDITSKSRLESYKTPMERCREGGTETKAIQYKFGLRFQSNY